MTIYNLPPRALLDVGPTLVSEEQGRDSGATTNPVMYLTGLPPVSWV